MMKMERVSNVKGSVMVKNGKSEFLMHDKVKDEESQCQ